MGWDNCFLRQLFRTHRTFSNSFEFSWFKSFFWFFRDSGRFGQALAGPMKSNEIFKNYGQLNIQRKINDFNNLISLMRLTSLRMFIDFFDFSGTPAGLRPGQTKKNTWNMKQKINYFKCVFPLVCFLVVCILHCLCLIFSGLRLGSGQAPARLRPGQKNVLNRFIFKKINEE